ATNTSARASLAVASVAHLANTTHTRAGKSALPALVEAAGPAGLPLLSGRVAETREQLRVGELAREAHGAEREAAIENAAHRALVASIARAAVGKRAGSGRQRDSLTSRRDPVAPQSSGAGPRRTPGIDFIKRRTHPVLASELGIAWSRRRATGVGRA